MDIGRFHYAVDTVFTDMRRTAAAENLQNLINQLTSLTNNSSQPHFHEQYKQQLESTREALRASALNNAKLEVANFLEDFDLKSVVGNGLFESIMKRISENQLSPHSVLTSLQELYAQLSKKMSSLDAINKGLADIGAPYDGEGEGDSEIEIKIPAEYATKTLSDLSREAKEWHRDICTVSEVFDPSRPEPTIRVLSTGSWEFYLASTPLVIFGIARSLRGINLILAELIQSKQLLEQLRATNAPAIVVNPYEEHTNSIAGNKLAALAGELVDQYYKGADDGRRAELKIALTQSLKRLSKKLSEGSKVGLRLTKPAKPKIGDEANPTAEESAAIQQVNLIETVRQQTDAELDQTILIGQNPEVAKALLGPDPE